jgi:hypothetical protein
MITYLLSTGDVRCASVRRIGLQGLDGITRELGDEADAG